MKTKILATLGVAALAMGASVTASQAAIISQPCETCGVAIGAPLPEGVFFVDLENYGKKDGRGATGDRLGVNIPVIVWSTPFSFYDNRVDMESQALLLLFNHSFGNGFSAGLIAGPRAPDNFTLKNRGAAADLRASFSYVGPVGGFGPIKAVATFAYSGNFGGVNNGPTALFNDNIYVDYTLTKTFDKFEIGIVGYAQTDLRQINGATYGRSVAVGGLIGYDFGKVTVQAYATREVASNGVGYGLPGKYDTRGYLRLIVPLYVAPTAPAPVVAKY